MKKINLPKYFMKIISVLKLFFISLFLIASSKANEINDFQIEGLSLGDSLYNHLSKEISKNQEFIYSNDKNFVMKLLPFNILKI